MKRKETERASPAQAGAAQPQPKPRGLEDEIELLRWAVRRLYALAQEQDNGEAVKTLAALSSTATRLGWLLQTQARLPGAVESEWDALLARALAEVSKELGV